MPGITNRSSNRWRAVVHHLLGTPRRLTRRDLGGCQDVIRMVRWSGSPGLLTARGTPARLRPRAVEVSPLARWVFDGNAETPGASSGQEKNLEDLLLRKTRDEGSAIEEGNTQGQPQARNCLYHSMPQMSLTFKRLFVTLASEAEDALTLHLCHYKSNIINIIDRDLRRRLRPCLEDSGNQDAPLLPLEDRGDVCVLSGV
jgi:hypothetical protein